MSHIFTHFLDKKTERFTTKTDYDGTSALQRPEEPPFSLAIAGPTNLRQRSTPPAITVGNSSSYNVSGSLYAFPAEYNTYTYPDVSSLSSSAILFNFSGSLSSSAKMYLSSSCLLLSASIYQNYTYYKPPNSNGTIHIDNDIATSSVYLIDHSALTALPGSKTRTYQLPISSNHIGRIVTIKNILNFGAGTPSFIISASSTDNINNSGTTTLTAVRQSKTLKAVNGGWMIIGSY